MDKKKIILIIIFLAIIAFGAGIYLAWIKNKPVQPEPENNQTTGNILNTEKSTSRLEMISSSVIVNYWISSSGDLYYVNENGSIFKNNTSKEEKILSVPVQNLRDSIVSEDGKYALFKSSRNGLSNWTVFDTTNNNFYPPVMNINSAVWMKDNSDIAMLAQEGPEATLFVTNPKAIIENAGFKNILTFNQADFSIQSPQKNKIYFVPKPSAQTVSDVWLFDVKTKKLSKFLSEIGLMIEWSKFGDVALKFSAGTGGKDPKLSLIDSGGNNVVNFKFITFPDKCYIASPKQLYCAIPLDQESLAGLSLPDDYLMRKVNFVDGFYQIDIDSRKINPIYESSDPAISASNITVLGSYLYFVNRFDGKLYRLKL